jgi:hypothetical protein
MISLNEFEGGYLKSDLEKERKEEQNKAAMGTDIAELAQTPKYKKLFELYDEFNAEVLKLREKYGISEEE